MYKILIVLLCTILALTSSTTTQRSRQKYERVTVVNRPGNSRPLTRFIFNQSRRNQVAGKKKSRFLFVREIPDFFNKGYLRNLRFVPRMDPLKKSVKRHNRRSMRVSTTTTEIPNFHQLLSLVRRGTEIGGNYKQWRKG